MKKISHFEKIKVVIRSGVGEGEFREVVNTDAPPSLQPVAAANALAPPEGAKSYVPITLFRGLRGQKLNASVSAPQHASSDHDKDYAVPAPLRVVQRQCYVRVPAEPPPSSKVAFDTEYQRSHKYLATGQRNQHDFHSLLAQSE